MANVSIKINGKTYGIGCDPGEEARVEELAAHIDQQVTALANSGGAASESHLLVLASIIMADELFEARENLKSAQAQYNAVSQKLEEVTEKLEIAQSQAVAEPVNQTGDNVDDSQMADVIANLAGRIEAIADRIQKP